MVLPPNNTKPVLEISHEPEEQQWNPRGWRHEKPAATLQGKISSSVFLAAPPKQTDLLQPGRGTRHCCGPARLIQPCSGPSSSQGELSETKINSQLSEMRTKPPALPHDD